MRFVLAAYGRKGHDTIRDIAHRWTGHPLDLGRYGYATCLCQRLHAGLDDRLDMTPATIEALARALVLAENGRDPYPARLWREAFLGHRMDDTPKSTETHADAQKPLVMSRGFLVAVPG